MGNATVEHHLVQAEVHQDLGILAGLTPGRGGVGHGAGLAAELLNGLTAQHQIAHQRLVGNGEFLGQGVVRSNDQAALTDELLDLLPALGTHFQVVLDHNGVTVHCEGVVGGVFFQNIQK